MICMSRRCNEEGDFTLKATVPPRDHKFFECNPVEIYSDLKLCAECAAKFKLKDIFTKDMKECVLTIMAHSQATPDFANAQIQIISINDVQLLMVEAHNATIH